MAGNDDDLMFGEFSFLFPRRRPSGEMPEDDDLNGLGDESEIDANNDETFGGPLPNTNTYDDLGDYSAQVPFLLSP